MAGNHRSTAGRVGGAPHLRAPLAAAVAAAIFAGAAAAAGDAPAPARRAELVRLVQQDCGSCHGMTLKGGLGSPLTAETLRGRSPETLAAAILIGRPGTPMPPWRDFLSEAEANWIVDQLLKGNLHAR